MGGNERSDISCNFHSDLTAVTSHWCVHVMLGKFQNLPRHASGQVRPLTRPFSIVCFVVGQASEAMILAAEAPLPEAAGGVLVRTLLPPGEQSAGQFAKLVTVSDECVRQQLAEQVGIQ